MECTDPWPYPDPPCTFTPRHISNPQHRVLHFLYQRNARHPTDHLSLLMGALANCLVTNPSSTATYRRRHPCNHPLTATTAHSSRTRPISGRLLRLCCHPLRTSSLLPLCPPPRREALPETDCTASVQRRTQDTIRCQGCITTTIHIHIHTRSCVKRCRIRPLIPTQRTRAAVVCIRIHSHKMNYCIRPCLTPQTTRIIHRRISNTISNSIIISSIIINDRCHLPSSRTSPHWTGPPMDLRHQHRHTRRRLTEAQQEVHGRIPQPQRVQPVKIRTPGSISFLRMRRDTPVRRRQCPYRFRRRRGSMPLRNETSSGWCRINSGMGGWVVGWVCHLRHRGSDRGRARGWRSRRMEGGIIRHKGYRVS